MVKEFVFDGSQYGKPKRAANYSVEGEGGGLRMSRLSNPKHLTKKNHTVEMELDGDGYRPSVSLDDLGAQPSITSSNPSQMNLNAPRMALGGKAKAATRRVSTYSANTASGSSDDRATGVYGFSKDSTEEHDSEVRRSPSNVSSTGSITPQSSKVDEDSRGSSIDMNETQTQGPISRTVQFRELSSGCSAWWSSMKSEFNKYIETHKNFVFKDYCPEFFGEIRNICGINHLEYMESLMNATNEKFSEGASGSFLYFSGDHKYIVKTTTIEEKDVLVRILPAYTEYIRANPKTLLVKFLGLHSARMYNQRIQFVVMQNAFAEVSPTERYDLKGSWINRSGKNSRVQISRQKDGRQKAGLSKAKSVGSGASAPKIPLYKDNDLQQKFLLPKEAILNLRSQMKKDSQFLASHNLMDYSLLVGVKHKQFLVASQTDDLSTDTNPFLQAKDGSTAACVVVGPEQYWFTIIDVLQEWNFDKKMESWAKRIFKQQDPRGISAVPADEYSYRFCQRVGIDAFDDSIEDEITNRMSFDSPPDGSISGQSPATSRLRRL
jgi:hypothetical protein